MWLKASLGFVLYLSSLKVQRTRFKRRTKFPLCFHHGTISCVTRGSCRCWTVDLLECIVPNSFLEFRIFSKLMFQVSNSFKLANNGFKFVFSHCLNISAHISASLAAILSREPVNTKGVKAL